MVRAVSSVLLLRLLLLLRVLLLSSLTLSDTRIDKPYGGTSMRRQGQANHSSYRGTSLIITAAEGEGNHVKSFKDVCLKDLLKLRPKFM